MQMQKLRDKRNSGIPGAGKHPGSEAPQRATGGPPRGGRERRRSGRRGRRSPSPGRPHPPAEPGVCLVGGGGARGPRRCRAGGRHPSGVPRRAPTLASFRRRRRRQPRYLGTGACSAEKPPPAAAPAAALQPPLPPVLGLAPSSRSASCLPATASSSSPGRAPPRPHRPTSAAAAAAVRQGLCPPPAWRLRPPPAPPSFPPPAFLSQRPRPGPAQAPPPPQLREPVQGSGRGRPRAPRASRRGLGPGASVGSAFLRGGGGLGGGCVLASPSCRESLPPPRRRFSAGAFLCLRGPGRTSAGSRASACPALAVPRLARPGGLGDAAACQPAVSGGATRERTRGARPGTAAGTLRASGLRRRENRGARVIVMVYVEVGRAVAPVLYTGACLFPNTVASLASGLRDFKLQLSYLTRSRVEQIDGVCV
ncbi:uncharacterized protein LOC134478628 [Cavia porcellus]|uniref:uncharacterized protein LOC134478628 n=1 Tax=Cavia porcellus TaxID=10141 RepID=UPI002FE40529